MRKPFLVGLLTLTLICAAHHVVVAQDTSADPALPIPLGGTTIGSVDTIQLSTDVDDPARLNITVTAQFTSASLLQALDRSLSGRNLIGRCNHRLSWRSGTTSIRGAGDGLTLRTRLGYEFWACGIPRWLGGNRRILGEAKWVDWRLDLYPINLETLEMRARVTNIVDFPNYLERLLDLRQALRLRVPLLSSCPACGCVQDRLNLTSSSPRFSVEGPAVRMNATFRVNGDITPALSCALRAE